MMLTWIVNNASLITLIFSGLVMLSTVVYAILTAKLVKETIILRRIQTDPKITMNMVHDVYSPFIVSIILENVGNGTALNIKFNILSEPKLNIRKNLSSYGFIQNGIKSLSGHTKFKTLFMSIIEEGHQIEREPILLEITYEDLCKRKYHEKLILDISYLHDIKVAQTEQIYEIKKSFNEISKTMKEISMKIKSEPDNE
jgi:hypothetical protein